MLSNDSSKGWTSEQGRYKETTWNSHTVVPTWNHVVKSPWLDFSTYIWGVGTPQNRDIGIPQNGWFIMENPINMDDSGPGRPIFGNTQSCASFGWQNGGNILRQCDVSISLQSWLIAFRCSLLMPAAVFKLHMLHYSLLIHSAHHLNTHTHKSHKQEVRSTIRLIFCCFAFIICAVSLYQLGTERLTTWQRKAAFSSLCNISVPEYINNI